MTTSEPDTGADQPKSAAAKLFDIRTLIGGLFTLYGVMLTVYGFFTPPEQIEKAAGININLWLGLGMLALGVFFLAWVRLAPLQRPAEPNPTGERSDESDVPREPPAH